MNSFSYNLITDFTFGDYFQNKIINRNDIFEDQERTLDNMLALFKDCTQWSDSMRVD